MKTERGLERGINFSWLFRRIVGQEKLSVTKKWYVVVWDLDKVPMTWILVLFFWRKFLFDRRMYHLNTIISTMHTRIICLNSIVIIQHSNHCVIGPPSSSFQSVLAPRYLNKKPLFYLYDCHIIFIYLMIFRIFLNSKSLKIF